MPERARGEGHVWCWTLEQHSVAGADGAALEVFWLRLPGFLGRESTEDCEAIFGDDWERPVLERLLPHDRWWLWWTESSSLRGLAEAAPRVRRSRRLPDTLPPNEPTIWIGRGLLANFGAALLPPRAALQALVFEHGPSLYSEFDPNFLLVLSRAPAGSAAGSTAAGSTATGSTAAGSAATGSTAAGPSPSELQRRLPEATPEAPGFDLLAGTADRVLMQWNGDLYLAARRQEQAALLDSLEAWATGYGLRVERDGAG